MISQEYRIWLSLGGRISGEEIIADIIQELRNTDSYKDLPPGPDTEDMLRQAAIIILAADQAHLYSILHTARTVLENNDIAKAKVIIEKAFTK